MPLSDGSTSDDTGFTPGQRLGMLRRARGLTQGELADLSGISQPYIAQLERDTKPMDRRQTQIRLAAALEVSVAQLLGEPGDPTDPNRAEVISYLPALRLALLQLAADDRDSSASTLEYAQAAGIRLASLRNRGDWSGVTRMLPGHVRELQNLGGAAAGLMVEALYSARILLKNLGFGDLARSAAELGIRAAEQSGDPAYIGLARYSWVQAFPYEAAELGSKLTLAAADELQPHSGPHARQAYGWLHLLAAQQDAYAGRADGSWAHMAEAAGVARSLPDPQRAGEYVGGLCGAWFGIPVVDMWEAYIAAELRDTGAALKVRDRFDPSAIPTPSGDTWFWTELARSLLAADLDEEAVTALVRAERSSPQQFRISPTSRDLLTSLAARDRRLSEPALGMLRRAGLEPGLYAGVLPVLAYLANLLT